MNRLLTAAVAVAAIAAFTAPEGRRLSRVRRSLYASAVQQELICATQGTAIQRLSVWTGYSLCERQSR